MNRSKGSQKPSHYYLHRSTPKSKKNAPNCQGIVHQNNQSKSLKHDHHHNQVSCETDERHHRHKRRVRSRRTTTNGNNENNDNYPMSTTTTGDDDEARPEQRAKRPSTNRHHRPHHHHHHHRNNNTNRNDKNSFNHIKNSLKRSQKYLNNFYSQSNVAEANKQQGKSTTVPTTPLVAAVDAAKMPMSSDVGQQKEDITTRRRASERVAGDSGRLGKNGGVVTSDNDRVVGGCDAQQIGQQTRIEEKLEQQQQQQMQQQKQQGCCLKHNATIIDTTNNNNKTQMNKSNVTANNTHSSSKSSTSAYVSATHSLASSHSSLCSNFNQVSLVPANHNNRIMLDLFVLTCVKFNSSTRVNLASRRQPSAAVIPPTAAHPVQFRRRIIQLR